jgi:pimeloyl-ACP methyl ester carboxylesterase
MSIRESAVKNKDVRIHYLVKDSESNLTPLVYIPGMLGSAEVFVSEMESLSPRKCISISLRGRGKSDVPSTGYSLIDHVSDIESVVNDCNLNKFVLMAYSMGVPYAIEFVAKNSSLIEGLIILEPDKQANLILSNYNTSNIFHLNKR